MRAWAIRAVNGVGDKSHQWEEWTGYAYHVRRRLTELEQLKTGPAIDCRGTDEWDRRFEPIEAELPVAAAKLAWEECK